MARTPAQEAARKALLATGKYHEYTNSMGGTEIGLKPEYAKNPSNSRPQNTTVPTTGTTLDTLPGYVKDAASKVTGIWGGMAGPAAQPIVGQVNDALSGRIPIIGGNATKVPEINPYEEALTEYREQIEALSMETDPDYNENLEQLSPEELEEEIL